jgi:xanthine dehydrogenase/oxidase
VTETATDKVANSIATAASMSTDLYGMSTLNACNQILERLVPIRQQLGPDATLSSIATTAFFNRIDLSAHGFFALDGTRCGYDWNIPKPDNLPENTIENSWKGQPFNYFTQGIAYSEVEVDVLTGNHKVLRSDVLVDGKFMSQITVNSFEGVCSS